MEKKVKTHQRGRNESKETDLYFKVLSKMWKNITGYQVWEQRVNSQNNKDYN